MSSIRKLAGDTVIYGVSTVLGRFLNYLLVPLHTSLFFPDQLAPQVQLYVYAAVSYTLLPLGLETAFFRFAAKENDRKQYYNLILSAVILMSAVCTTPIFIFSDEIAEFIQYPQSGMLVKWFAIIMALQGISTIPSAKLRLEGRGKKICVDRHYQHWYQYPAEPLFSGLLQGYKCGQIFIIFKTFYRLILFPGICSQLYNSLHIAGWLSLYISHPQGVCRISFHF